LTLGEFARQAPRRRKSLQGKDLARVKLKLSTVQKNFLKSTNFTSGKLPLTRNYSSLDPTKTALSFKTITPFVGH